MFGCVAVLAVLLPHTVLAYYDYFDGTQETPLEFDIEHEFQLPSVQDTRLIGAPSCYVAGIFALVAALEVAQHRTTGRQIKFSEQEFLDCQFRGCRHGSLEEYVKWLQVNDRLAPADSYPFYRAEPKPCRAAFSPDALTDIRVTGTKSIDPEDFESSIIK